MIVKSQLAQAEGAVVHLTADSIVVPWLVNPIDSCKFINAGLGGGGVRNILSLPSELIEIKLNSKIDEIVIAIGINDAQRGALKDNCIVD
jgi:hypothetical protein